MFDLIHQALNRNLGICRGGFYYQPFLLNDVSSSWSLKISKEVKSLGLSRYSDRYCSESRTLISSVKVAVESFSLIEDYPIRIVQLWPLHQIHKNAKFPKIATNNVSSQYSNSFFSKTTEIISVIKVSGKNHFFIEAFDEKLSKFNPCIKFFRPKFF